MADPIPLNPEHNNKIPPAVRAQAERAEQLQREVLGLNEPPADGQQPTVNQQVTDPPAEPHAAEPPPTGTAAAPPAAAPPSDAEARARTAEGRLAAEREQNQQMRGQIASLERMVADLQRQAQAPPPPPPPPKRLITPEEETDYGADMVSVMKKASREELYGEIETLRNELREVKNVVGTVGSRVEARDRGDLMSRLQGAVPNWLTLNSDENFIGWLQQPEPFSGLKRHDLLTHAYDLQDSNRVIKFFKSYLEEAAATGQVIPGQEPPPPAPPAANGKVPLETFAAPGRATPAAATAAPTGQKPHYTRAQISQFFTDKAAGRWRGREADAAAIEADIFRAGPEGRVTG